MKKQKIKTKINWLLVGILMLFVILPGGIFLKLTSSEINPYLVAVLRYGIIIIAMLPFMINAFREHSKLLRKKLHIIIPVILLTCTGGPFHVMAIASSSVSLVEIMNLAAPIVFAIISIMFTTDKVSRHAVIGLLFAVLGGLLIIIWPLFSGEGAALMFGWQPILLQGIVIVQASIYTVFLRKMNEAGIPLTSLVGLSFVAAFLVSIPMAIMDGGPGVFSEISNLSAGGWAMIIYLAIVISVVARIIRTKAYENIGTATHASLEYLYCFMAIVAPLFILGEALSIELIIGALLIIIGIVFTRKHMQSKSGNSTHEHAVHARH